MVPEGMLEAVVAASPQADRPNQEFAREFYRTMLEAALGWLSKNPIIPTSEQSSELIQERVRAKYLTDEEGCAIPLQTVRGLVEAWQQRMFLAPGDEQIHKDLADLVRPEVGLVEALNAAYRRGQKASGNGEESALFSASPDSGKVCNECVVQRITREGSYFPCALPKGHDGGHRAAGTCRKHGRYYGKVGKVPHCPQFPDCA